MNLIAAKNFHYCWRRALPLNGPGSRFDWQTDDSQWKVNCCCWAHFGKTVHQDSACSRQSTEKSKNNTFELRKQYDYANQEGKQNKQAAGNK